MVVFSILIISFLNVTHIPPNHVFHYDHPSFAIAWFFTLAHMFMGEAFLPICVFKPNYLLFGCSLFLS